MPAGNSNRVYIRGKMWLYFDEDLKQTLLQSPPLGARLAAILQKFCEFICKSVYVWSFRK